MKPELNLNPNNLGRKYHCPKQKLIWVEDILVQNILGLAILGFSSKNSMFQEIIFTPLTNPVFFTPNHFIFSCFLIFELGRRRGRGKTLFISHLKVEFIFWKIASGGCVNYRGTYYSRMHCTCYLGGYKVSPWG